MISHCGFDLYLHDLVIGDAKHLFIYLLVLYMCSPEKCLLKFFAYFKISSFSFLNVEFLEFQICFGY